MGQNKEELGQLLAFIEIIVKQPGNEDFIAGLQDVLLKSYQNNIGELSHLLSCINTLVQHPGSDKFVFELQSVLSKKYPHRISDSELDTLKILRFNLKMHKWYFDNSNELALGMYIPYKISL